jgi:hypothetical protein
MEWEEDADLPGIMVKWLSDHNNMGFTARLRYAPADWLYKSPEKMSYNKDGYRFIYILSGAMKIEKSPSNQRKLLAKKNHLIIQKPKSLWYWGSSELTDQGVLWLDIEYGKGTIIGKKPIIRSFIKK